MAIGFYFSGAGGTMQLPVNPAELTVRYQGNNLRTEVVKLGEINILRDRKLAAVSFPALLPGDDYYPFIIGRWRPPTQIASYFRGAIERKTAIRFVVSGIGINMRVSVEDTTNKWAAGDHESIILPLSLLEYRSYGASTLKIPAATGAAPKAGQPPRPSDKAQSSAHTVSSGDTLWAIAQKHLGDGSRYPEIAALNNIANPNLIYPGTTLKLPPR